MSIVEKKTLHHWNYFLALEDDVVRLARYLEPTTDNFGAYSLELARILSTAASEVDVVAKQFCQKLDPKSKAQYIPHYMDEITAACPQIIEAETSIPKFGLTLHPWTAWGKKESPLWWKAYNNVKHYRHTNFQEANLQNALDAVAGLFILLLFFYKEEGLNGQLSPNPVLFRPGRPFCSDRLSYDQNVTIYALDPLDLLMSRTRNGMV